MLTFSLLPILKSLLLSLVVVAVVVSAAAGRSVAGVVALVVVRAVVVGAAVLGAVVVALVIDACIALVRTNLSAPGEHQPSTHPTPAPTTIAQNRPTAKPETSCRK